MADDDTTGSTSARSGGPRFSVQLDEWLNAEGPKTLGAISKVFAEKSFAVMLLILMFIPALPLPTGGISHLLEVIAIVVAAQMVLGRTTVWLPKRWQSRELGHAVTGKAVPFMVRRVRWFEKFSRPRGAQILEQRWAITGMGVIVLAFCVAAILSPPFSGLDTLPAMGAVGIALAIILEDVVVLAVGVVIGSGGIVLMLTIASTIVHFMSGLF